MLEHAEPFGLGDLAVVIAGLRFRFNEHDADSLVSLDFLGQDAYGLVAVPLPYGQVGQLRAERDEGGHHPASFVQSRLVALGLEDSSKSLH